MQLLKIGRKYVEEKKAAKLLMVLQIGTGRSSQYLTLPIPMQIRTEENYRRERMVVSRVQESIDTQAWVEINNRVSLDSLNQSKS